MVAPNLAISTAVWNPIPVFPPVIKTTFYLRFGEFLLAGPSKYLFANKSVVNPTAATDSDFGDNY